MRRADFFLSIGLIVFGLVMFMWIIPSQSAPGERSGLPPATMPMLCAAVIVLLSALLLLKNLPAKWSDTKDDITPVSIASLRHIGLYFGIALVGLLITKLVGIFLGGVFLVAASMIAAGKRSPLVVGLWSLLTVTVVYALLWYGLQIPPP